MSMNYVCNIVHQPSNVQSEAC